MGATAIETCLRSCSLGMLLVAGSKRGVCYVDFGARDPELRRRLRAEFPFASFCETPSARLECWANAVARYVDGLADSLDVPLDVCGSRFQKRVWAALRRIPRGETRSYSEIARRIGLTAGARAVARACAANPVPVLTPCHRVVEKSGALGGYSRGVRRKRALLQIEGAR